MIDFPYPGHPSGWFQFGWSAEFAVGDVRPLHHFSVDLVAFRDDLGTMRVFDAYCPHLGAHLGHGGCVVGEGVRCPFHGWEWGAGGANTRVPYGDRAQTAVRIPVWEVREVDGLLYLWHDGAGGPPTWEPPELPESSSPAYFWSYPESARLWPNVGMVPQQQTENIVDVSHIKFVHNSSSVPSVMQFEASGPRFNLTLHQEYPTRSGSRPGRNELSAMGVGITHSRLSFDDQEVLLLASVIPVDERISDLRISLMTRLMDGEDGSSRRIRAVNEAHFTAADQDLPIWENQRYVARAPLVPAESEGILAFRRWAQQFYDLSATERSMHAVAGS